ncbi:MAG: hypothetical protein APF76_10470 [Desulfitibacter sp. BRH_c19]|nr:MAG: hypothetical protein APF76_10470 [Desulfitibacter sp. BRH_c19]
MEVFVQGSHKKQLFLNNSQLEMFNLTPGQELILQLGVIDSLVEVAIQNSQRSTDTLYMTETLLADFYYYQGEPLKLIYSSNSKLILGPSLGLTLTPHSWSNIDKSTAIKKRALLALEKGVLFYCFRLKNVDWKNNLVEAYCLNPNNYNWVKKNVPVPHVIYDRGSHPGPKTVESYNNQGKVNNIQWINTTRTFGKWETFQAFRSFKDTSKSHPETAFFTLPNLKEFLKKYMYTFIKDTYGRGGKKVFRIEKVKKYYLCKAGGNQIRSWKFANIETLYSFLCNTLGKNLIIQQGIFLAEIDGGPFDMRVLVQKDINSEWIISAVNFRIAKPGAIVTNFAAGARDVFLTPGEDLLHPGLSWEVLSNLSSKAVYALENSFGSLGEIGLDIGLDKEGKLWIIEANSRPSSIAYRTATKEKSNQIFGLPIDYATSLVKHLYNNSHN